MDGHSYFRCTSRYSSTYVADHADGNGVRIVVDAHNSNHEAKRSQSSRICQDRSSRGEVQYKLPWHSNITSRIDDIPLSQSPSVRHPGRNRQGRVPSS